MSEAAKFTFARDAEVVSIRIHCADMPAALELYRRLCEEASKGGMPTLLGETTP